MLQIIPVHQENRLILGLHLDWPFYHDQCPYHLAWHQLPWELTSSLYSWGKCNVMGLSVRQGVLGWSLSEWLHHSWCARKSTMSGQQEQDASSVLEPQSSCDAWEVHRPRSVNRFLWFWTGYSARGSEVARKKTTRIMASVWEWIVRKEYKKKELKSGHIELAEILL